MRAEFGLLRIGRHWRSETNDYVTEPLTPENKIVPDARFAIEHIASGKRVLFLIEVDLGTTTLVSDQPQPPVKSFTDSDARLANMRTAAATIPNFITGITLFGSRSPATRSCVAPCDIIRQVCNELGVHLEGRAIYGSRGYFSTTCCSVTDDIIRQYLELHSKREPTGFSR